MPATLKPLVNVLFGRTCRGFVNLIIADRMDIVGIGSVFSKADISLQTAREQYLAFKARIFLLSDPNFRSSSLTQSSKSSADIQLLRWAGIDKANI